MMLRRMICCRQSGQIMSDVKISLDGSGMPREFGHDVMKCPHADGSRESDYWRHSGCNRPTQALYLSREGPGHDTESNPRNIPFSVAKLGIGRVGPGKE